MFKKLNFRPSGYALALILALVTDVTSLFIPLSTAQDPAASPSSSPPQALQAPADEPFIASAPEIDQVELAQALVDLTSPWTVMCVAAHPDDEDGTSLTVLRRKYGVNTVTLFSTYGEGGQNAIGPELYEELGVIRAKETLRASQIQGSEAHFLGLVDFGFSKSADETFQIWNAEEAFKRMVQKIRELRPDVIITNHDTKSGHGHHQATGRMIEEAFNAAADLTRVPVINGVPPWQPKRLFVRIRRQLAEGEAKEKVATIDPNEIDPARNSSYAEQALLALQQHASQGPWPKSIDDWLRAQNNQTGKLNLIRYYLVREAKETPPLTPGEPPFLAGLKLPAEVEQRLLPSEMRDASVDPATILTRLLEWRRILLAAPTASDLPPEHLHRLELLHNRLERALAIAAGANINLVLNSPVLTPGKPARLTVTVSNTGTQPIRINNAKLSGWRRTHTLDIADPLLPGTEASDTAQLLTPANALVTVPPDRHLYDDLLFGQPFHVRADLQIADASFSVMRELRVPVAPAVEISSVAPMPIVRTSAGRLQPLKVSLNVINHSGARFRGLVKVASPSLRIYEFGQELNLDADEEGTVNLSLSVPVRPQRAARGTAPSILFTIEDASRQTISEHKVPVIFVAANVRPNINVGFIRSFDQTLSRSLEALGVTASELSMGDIESGDLTKFTTIIIDNRGYEAHPQLIKLNDRLLRYVEDGGNLVVFYHKNDEWNPDERKGRPQLAPYPIILGGQRITDERAPVRLLNRQHALLRIPNRITTADFQNWIQERGLYYPREWDPKYVSLFSSNDPGETALTGGLLVTDYGKGKYVYTSMVWYRQLRAGVPGAFRVFANLISQ